MRGVTRATDLKSQKRVSKMQLTKLYSRLVRLTSEESTDTEAILSALEETEKKDIGSYTTIERSSGYIRGER